MSAVSSNEIGTLEDINASERLVDTVQAFEYKAVATETWNTLNSENNKPETFRSVIISSAIVLPTLYRMARERYLVRKAIRFDQLSAELLPKD